MSVSHKALPHFLLISSKTTDSLEQWSPKNTPPAVQFPPKRRKKGFYSLGIWEVLDSAPPHTPFF